MPVSGSEGAVTEATSGSQSAVSAAHTLNEEIIELLADVPEPSDSGLLSPSELDAAFDTAVACSTTDHDVEAAPCQPCQPVDDGTTEVHAATPRGRGKSIKRRKRGRKPGDQRLKSM